MKYTFTATLTEVYEVSFNLNDRDWKEGDEEINMDQVVIGLMYGNEDLVEQFPNVRIELIEELEKIDVEGPEYDREN